MSAVISAPSEFLEAVAELRLPPKADERLHELMDRNTEGLLSDDEREQLGALVELSEMISVVRGQAMVILRRKP